MHPVVVHARVRNPPSGVEDLSGPGLDRDALVAAGQALTWRAAFSRGPHTAIPLTGSTAVLVDRTGDAGPEAWHARLTHGLIHRVAGEVTVMSMTAGLRDEPEPPREDDATGEGDSAGESGAAGGDFAGEDEDPVRSAVHGLTRLVADMDRVRTHAGAADQIVAETLRTHAALLGPSVRQDVSVRKEDDFTVSTVRSTSPDLTRDELERARSRIGLPWPARRDTLVGNHVGLALWREPMEAAGDEMWCRLDGDNALVTELWLRNSPSSPRPRE